MKKNTVFSTTSNVSIEDSDKRIINQSKNLYNIVKVEEEDADEETNDEFEDDDIKEIELSSISRNSDEEEHQIVIELLPIPPPPVFKGQISIPPPPFQKGVALPMYPQFLQPSNIETGIIIPLPSPPMFSAVSDLLPAVIADDIGSIVSHDTEEKHSIIEGGITSDGNPVSKAGKQPPKSGPNAFATPVHVRTHKEQKKYEREQLENNNGIFIPSAPRAHMNPSAEEFKLENIPGPPPLPIITDDGTINVNVNDTGLFSLPKRPNVSSSSSTLVHSIKNFSEESLELENQVLFDIENENIASLEVVLDV